MRYLLLALCGLVWLSPKNSFAQTAFTPAGVPGHALWWQPEIKESESPRLNGWPVFPFENRHQPLPVRDLPTGPLTVFSVYQPDASGAETIIWSFFRGEEARIVLTNFRLADLDEASYLHWPLQRVHQPRLVTYLHAGATGATEATRLALGHKPAGPDLPVAQGRGGMGEVIVYPSFLVSEERQRVETYLALKYGLTLGPGQDYLSPEGARLWDATRDSAFHHRILGIGHMPEARWTGTESQSTVAGPADRVILSATDSITPTQYLVLGDNDEPFTWYLDGNMGFTRRQWRIRATGAPAKPTQLAVPVRHLLGAMGDPNQLALLVDPSGTGSYQQADTIWAEHIDPDGMAHFRVPHWDWDGSGSDQFRLFTYAINGASTNAPVPWQIHLYPNPVPKDMQVQWLYQNPTPTNDPVRAFIRDAHGRTLTSWNFTDQQSYAATWQIDVPGVYWLTIQSDDLLTTQKLIVL